MCVSVWVGACKSILQQQASRLYKFSFQHKIRQFENKKLFFVSHAFPFLSSLFSLSCLLIFSLSPLLHSLSWSLAPMLSALPLQLCLFLPEEVDTAAPHRVYPDCSTDTFTSSTLMLLPLCFLPFCRCFILSPAFQLN